MTTTTKYPNADTSPERLEEISSKWECFQTAINSNHSAMIRDLLAMLEERDKTIVSCGEENRALEIWAKTSEERIEEFEAWFDQQRWRKFSEELPKETGKYLVALPGPSGQLQNWHTARYSAEQTAFTSSGSRSYNDIVYWAPIAPLPKE